MRSTPRHGKPATRFFATIRYIDGHKRIYKTVNGHRACNACTKT
jgi:hypothetical protein